MEADQLQKFGNGLLSMRVLISAKAMPWHAKGSRIYDHTDGNDNSNVQKCSSTFSLKSPQISPLYLHHCFLCFQPWVWLQNLTCEERIKKTPTNSIVLRDKIALLHIWDEKEGWGAKYTVVVSILHVCFFYYPDTYLHWYTSPERAYSKHTCHVK